MPWHHRETWEGAGSDGLITKIALLQFVDSTPDDHWCIEWFINGGRPPRTTPHRSQADAREHLADIKAGLEFDWKQAG